MNPIYIVFLIYSLIAFIFGYFLTKNTAALDGFEEHYDKSPIFFSMALGVISFLWPFGILIGMFASDTREDDG